MDFFRLIYKQSLRLLICISIILYKMLLKNITIFVLLVVIHSEEQDIEDSNIEELSEFFVKLISQYDKEGKGFIKRLDYPYFIRDVFIQGSKLEETTSPLVQKVLKAAKQFTERKEEEKQEIGIQEFYDDIISRFTIFLMENKEYQEIIKELYADINGVKQENSNQNKEL